MNTGVLTTIVAVLILAAIIGYLYMKKKSDKEKGNDEVERFLKSLESIFQKFILSYIDAIDITNIVNINEAQLEILESMYDDLWKLTLEELDETVSDEFNKTLIKKFLTRENVEAIARQLFESPTVQEKFTKKYNKHVVAASAFADQYEEDAVKFNGEIDSIEENPDLKPMDPNDIGIGEVELNPQTDEEVPVSADDNSVEIL